MLPNGAGESGRVIVFTIVFTIYLSDIYDIFRLTDDSARATLLILNIEEREGIT